MLRTNTHHSSKLQNHYNKYGSGDLKFQVLDICDKEIIFDVEQYLLDELKPYFNMVLRAVVVTEGVKKKGRRGHCKGVKFNWTYTPTEEHKRKLSEASKGKPKSKEHKANMPTKFKPGRVYTDEEKDVLKKAQKKRWDRDRDKIKAMRLKGWETRRRNMKLKEQKAQ